MTKPIAIIQTGQPVASALDKYGHFDQWFIRSMCIDKNLTQTYSVYKELNFPNADDISGIIITGSPSMVTESLEWSEKTIQWLKSVVSMNIPVLGVCYGHQLLAKLLGGEVDWNPKGRQMGQVQVSFTEQINTDLLLNSLLSSAKTCFSLPFFATHQQSVVDLPKDVTLLGATELDPHHCFRYKNHIWGLQFHPEFTAEIIKGYIDARSTDLISEDINPVELKKMIGNHDHGSTLLQRFAHLCFKNENMQLSS